MSKKLKSKETSWEIVETFFVEYKSVMKDETRQEFLAKSSLLCMFLRH